MKERKTSFQPWGIWFFYLVMIFLNLIWSQIWSLPGWSDSRDHLSFQHASPWRPTLEFIGVCLYLCCLESGTNMWMEESSLDASRILPDRETPTLVKLQNVTLEDPWEEYWQNPRRKTVCQIKESTLNLERAACTGKAPGRLGCPKVSPWMTNYFFPRRNSIVWKIVYLSCRHVNL